MSDTRDLGRQTRNVYVLVVGSLTIGTSLPPYISCTTTGMHRLGFTGHPTHSFSMSQGSSVPHTDTIWEHPSRRTSGYVTPEL